MKKINRRHRSLALFLAIMLFITSFIPYTAMAAEGDSTISIQTAEDLKALAKNCTLDTWSQGKTVVLQADIDISGTGFTAIPSFGGTFEGNGHTISGLSLSDGVSYQGLFRYIQESGTVQNLHVTGTVLAVGEQTYLGGIAGSNAGTIIDCSFSGDISGEEQVGGIAGTNEATGTIYQCNTEGTVTGSENTGGIAGLNGGTITGCVNRSSVNITYENDGQSLDDISISLDQESLESTTNNTGGIAGTSTGVLQNCCNEGDVGYSHVGYNVGGIVGHSSGYMKNCSNAGTVLGRKDVGGIVGQMIPDINLIFTEDIIEELEQELNTLSSLINETMEHAGSSSSVISEQLQSLLDSTQNAIDSVFDLSDAVEGGTTAAVDDISQTIGNTLDQLKNLFSKGETILDSAADGMDTLEQALKSIAAGAGLGEDALASMAVAMDTLQGALSDAKANIESIKTALENLRNALLIEDSGAVQEALAQLSESAASFSEAMGICSEALQQISDLLADGNMDAEELAALQQYLATLMQGFASAGQAVQGITDALSALSGEVDWEQVNEAVGQVMDAVNVLLDGIETQEQLLSELKTVFSGFSDMLGEMEEGMAGIAASLDVFEGCVRDLGDVANDIYQLFDSLSSREQVNMDTYGQDYHEAEDSLYGALTNMGSQMQQIISSANAGGDTLKADAQRISEQFQKITNLLMDTRDEIQESDSDDIWTDVSEEQLGSATLGKVKGCTNEGTVEGDLNIGGIAGAMSVEYALDPEEDITVVGKDSLRFYYETRAIIQDCTNTGEVTSKKDGAGGIVGRMALGYLTECENYGMVSSTSGDYTGGIAGISDAVIRNSYAKCILSGSNYVGGIAGDGYGIEQCVSLVSVKDFEGYTGAIAGNWNQEDGTLTGNRFVSSTLAGVDGVSYAGKAEPVAYEALMAEKIPAAFQAMYVTYMAEDEIVHTAAYAYGETLAEDSIPEVPKKDGYYGVWEAMGEDTVTCDYILEAVYTPYTTTLTSEAMRDEVHSVFLVEGIFEEDTSISAELEEETDGKERWTVTWNDTTDAEESYTVRFALPGEWEDCKLYLMTADGKRSELKTETEGSYCVFSVDGSTFTVEAQRSVTGSFGVGQVLLVVIAVAAVLLIAILIVLKIRNRRNKKGNKSRGKRQNK